ncbi:Serine--tRNA ligase [Dirofilaria immitis]
MFILSSIMLYISIKLFVHGEDLFLMPTLDIPVQFDCSRLPITYCCTTRVRATCEKQCSNIRCDSDFYRQGFPFYLY